MQRNARDVLAGARAQDVPWHKALKGVVVAGCSYELFAITTGLVPTITALCKKFRWAEAALFGALIADMHWPVSSPDGELLLRMRKMG